MPQLPNVLCASGDQQGAFLLTEPTKAASAQPGDCHASFLSQMWCRCQKRAVSSLSCCYCYILFPLMICQAQLHSEVPRQHPACHSQPHKCRRNATCLQRDKQLSTAIYISSHTPNRLQIRSWNFKNVFAWFKKKQIHKSCLISQEARALQMFSSVLMTSENIEQPHHKNWEVIF